MKKYIIGSTLIAFALSAGMAFAQVVGESSPLLVETTPLMTAPSPGVSGVSFATIALSAPGGGTYAVSSIPVTLTVGDNGLASDLSDCQIFNASGTALNTLNIPAMQSGVNIFTLDTPLSISSGTTDLTLKCNVSSSTTSGSTFQFVAGAVGLSSSSVPASLSTTLDAPASVAAGNASGALAIIQLNAAGSGQNVNVSSIPLTMSFNGVPPSDFTNCFVQNASDLGVPLNASGNAVAVLGSSGATFTLNTPLDIPAGSSADLVLTCAVSSATPTGSVGITLDPASIAATGASSGTIITPTASVMSNGSSAPTYGTVEIVPEGTPGTPNTGAGGNAPENILILAITGMAALLSIAYLVRNRQAA